MREICNGHLWIGNAGDLRDPGNLERNGIKALVHVALEERLPELSRELVCCHFPIHDGANHPAVLTAALALTASLIRNAVPTLICCSAGMSRTPALGAGAVAMVTGEDPAACLGRIIRGHPHDVSPAMWDGVMACVERLRKGPGEV